MIIETSDRNAFAAFVAPLQKQPESNIPMLGDDPAGIVKDLEEFETRLIVDDDAGEIRAAAGFDSDTPTQRVYLYGPWSVEQDWNVRADALLERVAQ
ncbi:MAG: hypothetical protein M3161_05490, partial [Actinomycetota bacterium]|nr:hypothetical protein [Actinomycetota bacterium]